VDSGRESWTTRWARRGVSFTLLIVGAALLTITSPVTVGLCLLRDGSSRSGRWLTTRWFLLLNVIVLAELLGLVLAGLLWLCPLSQERFLRLNYQLQAGWTAALFHCARLILAFRLEVEGLEQIPNRPFLLLVRHTSWADTVLAAALIANPRRLRLRYVLKRELLWGPCLDVVGQRLPNLFVDRSGRQRGRELQSLRQLARNMEDGEALLIYPEGTRFSQKKLHRERERVAEQSPELATIARQLRSVLPPRPAGTVTLLEEAPDLDIVLLGHKGMEDLRQLVGGKLRVKVWHWKRAELPKEGLVHWIYLRWLELDQWVDDDRG